MSEKEHKLADILRAIADGRKVQVRVEWVENPEHDIWVDIPVRTSISLYAEKTYRIKEEGEMV